MIELFPGLIVSRETHEALEQYLHLLKAWNQKINLVSLATLDQAWRRHILDSAQLAFYLPDKSSSIVDIGTGAGFPGLVLSLLGYEAMTLVEADKRKCIFLREVIRQTQARATVINKRIEAIQMRADYIVTRAFASLDHILAILSAEGLSKATLVALKGRNYNAEITEAKKTWSFDCKIVPSKTDTQGAILIIKDIQPLAAS